MVEVEGRTTRIDGQRDNGDGRACSALLVMIWTLAFPLRVREVTFGRV